MSTILIAITLMKITGRGIFAQPNRPHDLVDNFILENFKRLSFGLVLHKQLKINY